MAVRTFVGKNTLNDRFRMRDDKTDPAGWVMIVRNGDDCNRRHTAVQHQRKNTPAHMASSANDKIDTAVTGTAVHTICTRSTQGYTADSSHDLPSALYGRVYQETVKHHGVQ